MRLILKPAKQPLSEDLLRAYGEIAEVVGSTRMHQRLDEVIQRIAPLRRWYFYRHAYGPSAVQPRALAFRHEPNLNDMVDAYLDRFRYSDPLNKVVMDARGQPFILGLQPGDIPDSLYRERYMRDARIAERMSLVHFDATGCCVTSLARSDCDGKLAQNAIASIQVLARLVFPLLEAHEELLREPAEPCLNIAAIRAVLKSRCPALTERESEVCAFMAIGVPAKKIARDLSISVETVNTYRKRAFQRLSISRGRQLAQLLND